MRRLTDDFIDGVVVFDAHLSGGDPASDLAPLELGDEVPPHEPPPPEHRRHGLAVPHGCSLRTKSVSQ